MRQQIVDLGERLRQQETAELLTAAPTVNLSVASANAEGTSNYFARADHSHAITSSSAPGAAASILATDAAGSLALAGTLTLSALGAGYVKSSVVGLLSVAAEVPLIDLGSYTQGDLIYGGGADWQDLAHPAAANRVLQSTAAEVGWSAQAVTFPAAGAVPVGTGGNTQVAYWTGANTITGEAGMTYNAATDSLTAGDFFTGDGGQYGIAGNELLTFNAAGTAVFSGCDVEVQGNLYTNSSAVGAFARIQSTGADSYPFLRIQNDVQTWSLYTDGTLAGASADAFGIFDGANYRFLITTAGNVGIGTAVPIIELEVERANIARMGVTATAAGGREWHIGTAATGSAPAGSIASDLFFYDDTANAVKATLSSAGVLTATDFLVGDGGTYGISGAELLTFNAAGTAVFSGCDVGIGGAPAELFDVNGIADINSIIIGTNTDSIYHNNSDFYIKTETAHAIHLRTTNITRLLIAAGGTIGMGGVAAPAAQCHIDQSSSTAAIPVLTLDQADISEGLINFIGSERGVINQTANSATSVRVEANGTVYRLALYVDF